MKPLRFLTLFGVLATAAVAASLKDNIRIEALIVTKAELRRHMGAPAEDQLRPATYAELEASRGPSQPDYLVVRFLTTVPGHYTGVAEAKIDRSRGGTRLNVMLHFNKGWVEYFIPLDGMVYSVFPKRGSPMVTVSWNTLEAE